MGSSELPKKIKKEIRNLAAKAHEEELRGALLVLSKKFDLWKNGSLTSFDLTEQIHKFHNGDARELYKRYESISQDLAVAMAIANGILPQNAVSPEIIDALSRQIEGCKELKHKKNEETVKFIPAAHLHCELEY
jgi:hypothetical protein